MFNRYFMFSTDLHVGVCDKYIAGGSLILYTNNSNSSSLCLFRAISLAGEKDLHFDKFHEQESWNYFPSAGS